MQTGFYFDQSRCIGCYTCMAACRSWKRLDQEMPDLLKILSEEEGEFPDVSLRHLFLTCFHCAEPACIPTCPEGIIMKREADGVVVLQNEEECSGCQLCVEACPYGAIKTVSPDRIDILKCDLCSDRLEDGKPPACVANCPTEALAVGPMEELMAQYGVLQTLKDSPRDHQTRPSIIFSPGCQMPPRQTLTMTRPGHKTTSCDQPD